MDSDCLSFDYSFKQKRCILHDNIEGPPTDNRFPNNFETTPLQSSSDFVYYERLGLGNSTLYAFTNLTLQHRREFYINLKLSNKLGYSNIVSSEKVIVDLTPPLPGLIQYPSQDEFINEECGSFNNEQRCTGPTTPINNHRCIYTCKCRYILSTCGHVLSCIMVLFLLYHFYFDQYTHTHIHIHYINYIY